jgi:hypothetical protein
VAVLVVVGVRVEPLEAKEEVVVVRDGELMEEASSRRDSSKEERFESGSCER